MREDTELLSPAGSPEALRAAVSSGADAVYFGGPLFNARIQAANFTLQQLDEAFRMLHLHSRKGYITLNTLLDDAEIEEAYEFLRRLYEMGADAVIVQDIGLAAFIGKHFPALPIHGSTQMSGHNLSAAQKMGEWGFTRMVAAREMSRDDLTALCAASPIEIEVFGHGALCVSHSGQCLMSSIIGGRSANRGVCAQPCRLPYNGGYPLSLKDLSLAGDMMDFLSCGISSLKIEGRMKSPDYVGGVTAIYRRLIDQRRNATSSEITALAAIFSREGFTSAYFRGQIDQSMFGRRREEDKQATREAEPTAIEPPRIPIGLSLKLTEGQSLLTAKAGEITAMVSGEIPTLSPEGPLTAEKAAGQLSKLGGTPFEAVGMEYDIQPGLTLRKSQLNQLRRDACEALEREIIAAKSPQYSEPIPISQPDGEKPALAGAPGWAKARGAKARGVVSLASAAQYTSIVRYAEQIAHCFVPLEGWEEYPLEQAPFPLGVRLPRVILPSEQERVTGMLAQARKTGFASCMLANIGHIAIASQAGFEHIYGDIGFNLFNSRSADRLNHNGVRACAVSAELPLKAIRALKLPEGFELWYYAYGYLPVMLLESVKGEGRLRDRIGEEFALRREQGGRHELLNNVPVYLGDRAEQYRGLRPLLSFTIEDADQTERILQLFADQSAMNGRYTRGKNT